MLTALCLRSPWGHWPLFGLGTSLCHPVSPQPSWRGDCCQQLVGSQRILPKLRAGKVPAERGEQQLASPSPCRGTWAGTCGWGVGPVGLEMSTTAPRGGQWLPASPHARSSLPAAAALANIAALGRPPSSLLRPVKTAAGPHVSLSWPSPSSQSSTALGERVPWGALWVPCPRSATRGRVPWGPRWWVWGTMGCSQHP